MLAAVVEKPDTGPGDLAEVQILTAVEQLEIDEVAGAFNAYAATRSRA